MLHLLIPLALILGGTWLFLLVTGRNATREMERRQARFRELSEAYGDVPRVHPEAIARGGRGSSGEGSVKKTAPALVRTSHVRTHDTGVTNR